MSSLVSGPNWLEIQLGKVADSKEQHQDEQQPPPACDDNSVFCCPNCGAPVGSTDGQQLTVGAVIINSPVQLSCVACRKPYNWQPAK